MPLLAMTLLLCGTQTGQKPLTPEQIAKRASASVVQLVATKGSTVETGTGYLAYRPGVVITAWQLLKDATSVTARAVGGEEFELSGLIDKDERRNVAAARVKMVGKPMLLTQAKEPARGSSAVLIAAEGNTHKTSTVSIEIPLLRDGSRYLGITPAETGACLGAPLLNREGLVIGMALEPGVAVPSRYIAALDFTLKTKPWEAPTKPEPEKPPKPEKPLVAKPADPADLGYKVMRLRLDAALAALAVFDLEIAKYRVAPKEIQVPAHVFTSQRMLQSYGVQLSRLKSNDSQLQNLITDTGRYYGDLSKALGKMVAACKRARTKGWDAEASFDWQEAVAVFRTAPDWAPLESRLRELSPGTTESIPEELFGYTASREDEIFRTMNASGIHLDARHHPRLHTLWIRKGTPAMTAGLEPYSEILAANGQTFSTWTALANFLTDSAGRQVILTVRRPAGTQTNLTLNVPALLAAERSRSAGTALPSSARKPR